MLNSSERGAAAVFIASTLILLMGVAAVVLDLSAGFNERSQNQNAGDNGVMAGALEKAKPDPDNQAIVTNALEIVQANLTAGFPGGIADTSWIELWRSCTDDGNPGWQPLPEPTIWGGSPGATLDCISQTGALLRVRIPDQLVGTTFGAVIGFDSITTHALSIAKVAMTKGPPPIVPFGLDANAGAGEFCLSTAPTGLADAPCDGSQTGSFGPFNSPLFGTYGTHQPECDGNKLRWFERNLVWGLDHPIEEYPGTIPNSLWSKAVFDSLIDAKRDACKVVGGLAVEKDGFTINSVDVDTGFPHPQTTNGLVSNEIIEGRASRLQQRTDGLTRLVKSGNEDWHLDNVGPWAYLTDDLTDPEECRRATYFVSPPMSTEEKKVRFKTCLNTVATSGAEVFQASIIESPRFVWAPQHGLLGSPTGGGFTPVRQFWPAFLGTVWFNCSSPESGKPCGVTFTPDMDETDVLCDGKGCLKLSVSQLAGWLLPESSLPLSVREAFDTRYDDLEAQLFQ